MTQLDLLADIAQQRRDEFLRHAAARRLAAAVRAPRGQLKPNYDPLGWLRRFASSLHTHHAAPARYRVRAESHRW